MLLGWACLFVTSLVLPAAAHAQQVPFCEPDQEATFALGFAALQQALGPRMGEPTECEHANSDNGDTLQHTTTGLAFYRKSTNTPTFTDGWNHWALSPSGPVVWSGDQVDPPNAQAVRNGELACRDVGPGPCVLTQPELVETLSLLARTAAGGPLVGEIARAGYSVHFAQTPPNVLGMFRPSRQDVALSTRLADYPLVDRVPVLGHELQHVADWLSQGARLTTAGGCLATEANAFHTQSQIWLELQGGQLRPPANDVEREFNAIVRAMATAPDTFLSDLVSAYDEECLGG